MIDNSQVHHYCSFRTKKAVYSSNTLLVLRCGLAYHWTTDGLVNNLPIDVLRAQEDIGYVFAFDVSAPDRLEMEGSHRRKLFRLKGIWAQAQSFCFVDRSAWPGQNLDAYRHDEECGGE